MHLRYLIGGTGNQLFQIATAPENASFSAVFLNKYLCKILKLQTHERLNLKQSENFLGLMLLPMILIDAILARVMRFTLFVDFDLTRLKCRPFINFISVGYFQSTSELLNRTDFFDRFIDELEDYSAIHVRGGDFLLPINKSEFGTLPMKYYNDALENNTLPLRVFTDDYDYAFNLFRKFQQEVVITEGSLELMIRQCLNAKFFVASNSTLSFWISIARQKHGRSTTVPSPFQKKSVLEVPKCEGTYFVQVDY